MKVVFCLSNVNPLGGVDLATCTKVNAISETDDCQVWLVITEKPETLPIKLSPKVHLVDLTIRYNDNKLNFPWNLYFVLKKKRRHKKGLVSLFSTIQPDIIVSISNELSILTSIRGPWKIIREQHSVRKWDGQPIPSSGIKALLYKVASYQESFLLRNKVDKVVVLTQEQKRADWPDNDNVIVIPNPIRFNVKTPSPLNEKRAIAVGRLAYEKNYTSLVRAWARVASSCPSWTLDIYGEGGERQRIEEEIERNHLIGIVSLKGGTTRIEKELLASSLFVMTSKYEAFSLAIVEALSCGLPVVSYSCPYGPLSIIDDGYNGYLVPLDDEVSLANRICQLFLDEPLRKQMGAKAFDSAKQYGTDRIVGMWMDLFRGLIVEKQN